MDPEILQQLELMRGYLFIIMCAILLWVFIKVLQSIQRVFIGFKKALDTNFDNKMLKLMDLGDYDKVITECKAVVQEYPNHVDATWYLAKAYFYSENNKLSMEYFKKAIYLVPSWEETAETYIKKLNDRKKII